MVVLVRRKFTLTLLLASGNYEKIKTVKKHEDFQD